MVQLKLPQLRIFCALVDTGSVVQAAEKMHCVPSNISTRIRELEQTVGVSLVNRDKQRLTLTPEGRAFYPQAIALLKQSEQCLNFFQPDSLRGELKLGALDVAMGSRLQQLMLNFMHQHHDVTVSLACHSSLPLMDRLLAGDFDMIFVDGPVEHPVLTSQLFAPESLSLVTHHSSLAAFFSAVNKLTLYTFGKHCFYHVLMDAWLTTHQLTTRQRCEIESYPLILGAVRQQLGFTVMPNSFIDHNPEISGLYCYPLKDIPACDIYLVWRHLTTSPVEQAFIALVDGPLNPKE